MLLHSYAVLARAPYYDRVGTLARAPHPLLLRDSYAHTLSAVAFAAGGRRFCNYSGHMFC
jgi:hypothetical protein